MARWEFSHFPTAGSNAHFRNFRSSPCQNSFECIDVIRRDFDWSMSPIQVSS